MSLLRRCVFLFSRSLNFYVCECVRADCIRSLRGCRVFSLSPFEMQTQFSSRWAEFAASISHREMGFCVAGVAGCWSESWRESPTTISLLPFPHTHKNSFLPSTGSHRGSRYTCLPSSRRAQKRTTAMAGVTHHFWYEAQLLQIHRWLLKDYVLRYKPHSKQYQRVSIVFPPYFLDYPNINSKIKCRFNVSIFL